MSIQPIHTPENAEKIETLADDMRANGWKGAPILIDDEDSNEPQAFTGSHRLAAAELAEIEPETYSLEGTGVDVAALMFDCNDDEDRMAVIEASGDAEAIRIMRGELKINDAQ